MGSERRIADIGKKRRTGAGVALLGSRWTFG